MGKNRGRTIDGKMGTLRILMVPTVVYGSESCVLNVRVGVFEMKCLRKLVGLGVIHMIRNIK